MSFQRMQVLSVVLVLSVTTCLLTPLAYAEEQRWSFSVLLGGHLPDLKPLSDGLYKSQVVGDAEVLLYEGGQNTSGDGSVVDQNITETMPFVFDNQLPSAGIGTVGGIEFVWHANDRHSFIIGTGTMEDTAIAQAIGNLPMQQYFVSNEVLSVHRAKISYTEYTLGWRYNLVQTSKVKFYSRLSLHEVFDIDFRDDYSFTFTKSPIPDLEGVRRVMVVEAQTASLLMGQVGFGAEWFVRDWWSLGFEAGWMVGESSFTLKDVRARNDFLAGDNVNLSGMPYMELSDGTLGYLEHGTTSADVSDLTTRESKYVPIHLRFDGFRYLFRISFYF